jgi:PLP dependent protein
MNDPIGRVEELSENLARVRGRIAAACDRAGRAADSVTLIAITKNFPATDVRILAELGVTDVGENRHPEAIHKRSECLDLGLRWHFVGALQSNKAQVVSGYSDVVHSVDRHKLVSALSRGAREADRMSALDCFVQVSLDEPGGVGTRAGVEPAMLGDLAGAVAEAPGLRLVGLMAIAPLGGDPRAAFGRLACYRTELALEHPAATWLSAGMSGDLEEAIAAGATHVRVGRSVLGARPPVK